MRPDSIDSSVGGGIVLYEEDIRSQICYLQNLLRDFRRQISSSKQVSKTTDSALSITDQPSIARHLVSTAVTVITFLGYLAYIVWPMFFPLAVYLSEGPSPFCKRAVCVGVPVTIGLILNVLVVNNKEVRASFRQICRWVKDLYKTILAKIEENKAGIQKIIYCTQVTFMVTLAVMVILMTIRCRIVHGHILCASVSVVFFLLGLGLPYMMKRHSKALSREQKRQPQSSYQPSTREPQSISRLASRLMTLSFWPSSIESSGSGPVHSSPKHRLFGLMDPISGTTFSPIKGVSCLSPPPTYMQAISYRTLMSPSCRSTLFQ